jgi:cellulose synthase/poly-beta-1,6-N-acetylglucosamine synthase-like glycosyltransferase
MSSSVKIPGSGSLGPSITLVATILNEQDSLLRLLESIEQQSYPPNEVIFADGGSTDRTLSILESWTGRLPLTILQCPGANISNGRNLGIERATSELVAVTDAGVILDRDWLRQLVAPFCQSVIPVDVVSGFFLPSPIGDFETALAATTLPDAEEIDQANFLPSSRSVAFRRSWFTAGVRYPEWLDYCEDLVFDLRLKRAGARFLFQPGAIARFRPRSEIRSFWRQYFRYARGDGKAGLFWKRHVLRYVTYLVVLPSFVFAKSPLWRLLVLLAMVGYMCQPVQRLWNRSGHDIILSARLIPLSAMLRGFGDIAKMAGYPAGLLWRARRCGLRRDWRTIPEAGDRQERLTRSPE